MLPSQIILQSILGFLHKNAFIIMLGCLALRDGLIMAVSFPLTSFSDHFPSFCLSVLASMTIAPLLASGRIFGMQPLTFACLIIPIIVQVAILLIWAAKWRSPD